MASVLAQVYRVGTSGYGSATWFMSSEPTEENWWVVDPQRPSALSVVSYTSRKSRKNAESHYKCEQVSREEFSGRSLLPLLKQADHDLTGRPKLLREQKRRWFTAEDTTSQRILRTAIGDDARRPFPNLSGTKSGQFGIKQPSLWGK